MEMNGGSASTDYSDFEYQQTAHSVTLGDSGNVNATGGFQVEPLEGQGGLNTNEVAELVAMFVTVSVEYEGEEGTAPSDYECRGVIGANLGNNDSFELENGANSAEDGTLITGTSSNPSFASYVEAEDQIFIPVRHDGSTEGSPNTIQYERQWRELTNRGPVLDASDSIDTVLRLVKSGGNNMRAVARLHLIWDTAEVSDAGRAFSVPN